MCNKWFFGLGPAAGKKGNPWKSTWNILILNTSSGSSGRRRAGDFKSFSTSRPEKLQNYCRGQWGLCQIFRLGALGSSQTWSGWMLQRDSDLRVEPSGQVKESFPSEAHLKPKQKIWTSPPDLLSKVSLQFGICSNPSHSSLAFLRVRKKLFF